MAIRLKKLARELKTSPSVVLSALADLGYDRYKSEMDMVADPPADKVRKLARKKGLKKPCIRIKKALYGLQRAGADFGEKARRILLSLGFVEVKGVSFTFLRREKLGYNR